MTGRRERLAARLDEAVARYRAGDDLADIARDFGGPSDDVARLILARAGTPLRARRQWTAQVAA